VGIGCVLGFGIVLAGVVLGAVRYIDSYRNLSTVFSIYQPYFHFIDRSAVLDKNCTPPHPTEHFVQSFHSSTSFPQTQNKKVQRPKTLYSTSYFNSTLSITTSCEPSTSPVAPSKNFKLVSSLKGVVNVYSKRSIFSLSSAISERYLVY
jgi:hypothetical protein